MINRQITHSKKEHCYRHYRKKVTAIGGISWQESVDTAIQQILKGTHYYFVKNNYEMKKIVVKYKIEENRLVKYLKAQMEESEQESLLSLYDL